MALEIVNPDLKAITLQVLQDGFTAMGITLTILDADPKTFAQMPCISVNLTADNESASHIGDSLADEYYDSEDEVYTGTSALFAQQVEVKLWSTKSTERDRLGLLVKAVLFLGRGTSANPGLYVSTDGISGQVRISGGHDEGISDTSGQYSPHDLYARTYYVGATTELTIQEPGGAGFDGFTVNGTYYAGQIGSTLPEPTQTPIPAF